MLSGPSEDSSLIFRSSEVGVLLHYLLLYPPPPLSLVMLIAPKVSASAVLP